MLRIIVIVHTASYNVRLHHTTFDYVIQPSITPYNIRLCHTTFDYVIQPSITPYNVDYVIQPSIVRQHFQIDLILFTNISACVFSIFNVANMFLVGANRTNQFANMFILFAAALTGRCLPFYYDYVFLVPKGEPQHYRLVMPPRQDFP